ncbi:MAG TPA: ATP-binding protein [Polyangiaceae bacterium]
MHELRVHQVELEMQNEELRNARHEIEAGLRRYRELFDFAPMAYVVVDAASAILDSNLEFARMIGMPRSILPGWALASFVEPALRTPLRELLRGRLAGDPEPGTATLEASLHRKLGEPIAVRLIASSYSSDSGTVLVAMHDLTAIKRAECAREEIERTNAFLAALSHELRNPLFPIHNSLSMLDRAEPGSEEASRALATIHRQVSHLGHIVDDLLDVSRVARGKIDLRLERLDLSALVAQTMDDHRAELQEKSVALEARFDREALWVAADRTRLVQVVGNLLLNASKFTSAGGHVEVGLHRDGGEAVLSVRDDGVGIPDEVRERLFLPFTQAPQTLDRTRGGLGLGLAMVKGLVELHGGAVGVWSDGPDRGSEFTVRLPLVEPPAAREVVPAVAQASHPESRRVLVIEDNVDAADSMRELLEYDGHDARVAYDGVTAVALAHEFHPDVVLCDIGLPGMDGYAVARAMRAEADLAGTYLVALSGYSRPEDRRLSAEAGFDRHIAKPPSDEEIGRILAGGR